MSFKNFPLNAYGLAIAVPVVIICIWFVVYFFGIGAAVFQIPDIFYNRDNPRNALTITVLDIDNKCGSGPRYSQLNGFTAVFECEKNTHLKLHICQEHAK